ncbi:hypothetical protein ACI7RC_01715 [Brevibacillus sp. B_LB10_24]|uniref:hypothetical protein n=1 Tax=Brevibacillus sp. B_LB10_24 TaxID=3380645 RepID=UPI0038BD6E4A
MEKLWRIRLGLMCLVCLILYGCSANPQKPNAAERNLIVQNVDSVEKVSVLTTEGQDIPLDVKDFSRGLLELTGEVTTADQPLPEKDVKFSLIVYRAVEAPLIIDVGENVCRIGEASYSGPGARNFYSWVRELIGAALFQQDQVESVDIVASDLNMSQFLQKQEANELWEYLRSGEYREKPGNRQFPLYPYYRLKFDTGRNIMEVTVLTPALVSVKMGKEIIYYHVSGQMFAWLTGKLPLQQPDEETVHMLFKASGVKLLPAGGKAEALDWKVADSIVQQGIVHQVVRVLQHGTALAGKPEQAANRAEYVLRFTVGEKVTEVAVYEHAFSTGGSWFERKNAGRDILTLFGMFEQPKKSS